ncbi:hypothetical protein I7X12_16010 [Halosimplex litoreum]|uniref:DUF7313 domain-containing protein n=1 Tax=Halosimplex litoreum TaxID=1198301 RepID=A0A7T3KUL8_9EURY|nr:hypothetical protein [Halosimplex litoreum]QPV62229.1 hypothetical protein I7X12_16010 [Halosimplex litoreum]
MVAYELFGPVDAVLDSHITEEVLVIEAVLLGLVVLNIAARALAHRRHLSQAESGDADELSRHPFHVFTNVALVLGSFYFLTVHQHAGMVTAVIAIFVLMTDLFEFESRKVEVRREIDVEPPKAAIGVSLVALMYVAYVTFFYGPLGQFL